MYKMISQITVLLVSIITIMPAAANDSPYNKSLIRLKSPYTVKQTLDNLEKVLNNRGMTVFRRISHSAGARKAGLELRDTELLVFGNPKVGTPLMICAQTAAIDLPQKALAYEDETGQVWLAYNNPRYIQRRHNIEGCNDVIEKIGKALSGFTSTAVSNN